jgi:hypothetical protein
MPHNMNNSPSLTPATGDQLSEQSVIRTVNFDRYEIEIELTESGKFLSIISIKVNKSFIESMKNRQPSDVHDVEGYYSEE